jgi:Tol biopolymer transport system component
MKIYHLRLICLIIVSALVVAFTSLRAFNPFLPPPAGTAIVFGKGEVSDGFGNRDMAISPAGDEFFYTMQQGEQLSVILHSQKKGDSWTTPEVATFSGKFSDLEPAFSPDGNRLYFVSRRPVNNEPKKDFDIWYVSRTGKSWSAPERLPAPVNSTENEYYPSVTKKGDLYFTLDVGASKEDIVVCKKLADGSYAPPVSLPPAINSAGYEFNAYVDPDDKMILFTAHNRPGGFGNGDIFISRRDSSNVWTAAVNAGPLINSPRLDYCPFISPDKKYLFFTSNRTSISQPFEKTTTAKELKKSLLNAGNGLDDIYWIDFNTLSQHASQ